MKMKNVEKSYPKKTIDDAWRYVTQGMKETPSSDVADLLHIKIRRSGMNQAVANNFTGHFMEGLAPYDITIRMWKETDLFKRWELITVNESQVCIIINVKHEWINNAVLRVRPFTKSKYRLFTWWRIQVIKLKVKFGKIK